MKFACKVPHLDRLVASGAHKVILQGLQAIGFTHVMTDITYVPFWVDVGPANHAAHVVGSTNPNPYGTDDYSAYDTLVSDMATYGITLIPSIHSIAFDGWPHGMNPWEPPSGYASCMWPVGTGLAQSANSDENDYETIAMAVCTRYASGGSHASAYPIDSCAIWVEPNTSTGNCGGLMTPTIMCKLVSKSANALRNGPLHTPPGPGLTNIFAPEVGTCDVGYITSMTTTQANWADGVTHITNHIYPAGQLPNVGSGYVTYPRQPGSQADIQSYVRANLTTGYQPKKYAVTEAAYSGKDGAAFEPPNNVPNIWSPGQAATNEQGMMDILRGFTTPNVPVDVYIHFLGIDDAFWSKPDDHNFDHNALVDQHPYSPKAYTEGMGLFVNEGTIASPTIVNKPSGDMMAAYITAHATSWP